MAKSAQVGALHTTLTLTARQFEEGLKRAGARAKQFATGLRSDMKGINDSLGPRGPFGQFGKLLRGGGLIGGFALMGRAVEDLTANLSDLAEKWKDNSINAAEFGGEVLKAIPAVGGFVRGGENIGKLIFGDPESEANKFIAKLAQGTARVKAEYDKQLKERRAAEKRADDEDIRLFNERQTYKEAETRRAEQIAKIEAEYYSKPLPSERAFLAELDRWEENFNAAVEKRDAQTETVRRLQDKQRKSEEDEREAAIKARRADLLSRAGGILGDLRAAPPLAGAVTLGSREAFRFQQERIARAAGTPLDEEKLAKEAVELAKKQLKEQEQTNRILEGALEVVGI